MGTRSVFKATSYRACNTMDGCSEPHFSLTILSSNDGRPYQPLVAGLNAYQFGMRLLRKSSVAPDASLSSFFSSIHYHPHNKNNSMRCGVHCTSVSPHKHLMGMYEVSRLQLLHQTNKLIWEFFYNRANGFYRYQTCGSHRYRLHGAIVDCRRGKKVFLALHTL